MAIFKPSRIIAVAIVLGAVAWIASGALAPHADETAAAPTVEAPKAAPPILLQKVSIAATTLEAHRRDIVLSCTTKADRSSMAVARGGGVIVQLSVSRGSVVHAGDIIAILSDEGRESMVKQAQALLDQRTAEYEAIKRLIDRGDSPKNQLPALEAAVAVAQASLAAAKAESAKSVVRSPIDGIVDTVPVQVGQAVQPAAEIAEVIDPDPMLAVGAVGERQRGHLSIGQAAKVRFIDETEVEGTVSFVGLSADKATRTYPVEARMANLDAAIPDGVSCEMTVSLEPIQAAAVARSALVFSDDGRLGVRTVGEGDKARFVPVTIVDDRRETVWVSGLEGPSKVIVVGQDFVKDGDQVEAIPTEVAINREPPA
ncbi:MAG: efflux RND transporter periplasmic adaptor subunit [Bauldia sp.]|nr:MAG: efflux RND transporter periplasmic adaptor subunit [Bauldia sp.]